jgi:hypothetical protein
MLPHYTAGEPINSREPSIKADPVLTNKISTQINASKCIWGMTEKRFGG